MQPMTDRGDDARRAEQAAVRAQRAEDEAEEAAAAAFAMLPDDDPLLETHVRAAAAGVDDDHPYGAAGEPVGERSAFRIAFTATLGVLIAVVLARAVQLVSDVIVLIVMSGFLAVGLNPAVEFLQRRGWRRSHACAAVMGAVLLFFVAFVAAAVPPVARQASELREQIPRYAQQLQEENSTFRRLDAEFNIVQRIREAAANQGAAAGQAALGIVRGVLSVIFKTLTVLILTLYFLGAYPRIKRGALRLVPRTRRPRVGLLADEILDRVGGYVLGNLLTSLVAGVAAVIFLAAVGVPYPIALAMLVAFFDLIPLIGATLAAVVCTIVAFFVSVPVGVATLVYFTAYQQFENYVLVPRVMKRTVDVSPIATIVAALIGGALLGVLGALLAVPTAAAISLIGSEVLIPRQDNA
jgi:predicted PurR-regulated permease PerM